MPQVVVEMTSQEAAAWAGIQRLARGTDEFEKSLKKTATAAKEAAAEQKKLEQAATRVFEETRTPMERYHTQMAKLSTMLQQGAIDQRTFARAANQANESLSAADQVLMRLGMSGKKAFADWDLSKFLTAGQVANGVAENITKMLDAIRRSKEESANAQKASEFGMGSFAQLTDDPKEAEAMRQRAKQIYSRGGAPNLDAAAGMVFATESINQQASLPLLEKMYASSTEKDPRGLAFAGNAVVKAMGQDQSGDLKQVIAQAFMASRGSPYQPSQVLQSAARGAEWASLNKHTSAELMASTAVISQTVAPGSGKDPGTSVAALESSLQKIGSGKTGGSPEDGPGESLEEAGIGTFDFRGKTQLEKLQMIHARKLSPADEIKLFGEKDARKAYLNIVNNQSEYLRMKGTIEQAKAHPEMVDRQMGLNAQDPSLNAVQMARAEQASAEVANEAAGVQKNVVDAVRSHIIAKVRKGEITSQFVNAPMLEQGYKNEWEVSDSWGASRVTLLDAIKRGQLEDDPRLLKSAVEQAGGEEEVFKWQQGYWRPGAAKERYRATVAGVSDDAAASLNQAAENLNQASQNLNRPLPTLTPSLASGDPR